MTGRNTRPASCSSSSASAARPVMRRCGTRLKRSSMPAPRSVVSMQLRELGDFSPHPQGRPCGPATTPRSPGNRPHPLLGIERTSPAGGAASTLAGSWSRRIVVALPLGRVDVLPIAVATRGTLVMKPMLRSPTTTRTPQPPKRGPDLVPHDGAPPQLYIESPPGGFQWPLASASDRYRLASRWS
jgi:hypothetical protein